MVFVVHTNISKPLTDVFRFFTNVHRLDWSSSRRIVRYESLTRGDIGSGSRFIETVRIGKKRTMDIHSQIKSITSNHEISYRWESKSMHGELHYRFTGNGSTSVMQIQTLNISGAMIVAAPFIRIAFYNMVRKRITGIKHLLEATDNIDTLFVSTESGKVV